MGMGDLPILIMEVDLTRREVGKDHLTLRIREDLVDTISIERILMRGPQRM